MLGKALNIITGYLEPLGFFNSIYAIADRVNDGDKTFPAYYKGEGQYTPIEYDTTYGMCYFRKNGKASFSNATDDKRTSSCSGVVYEISYPIKLVCLIPKSKAECDSAFADDYFAQKIIGVLTSNSIPGIADIRIAKLISTGYESDNIKILQEEYSNYKEIVDINYKWSYLSIDLNLEILIDASCLNNCSN